MENLSLDYVQRKERELRNRLLKIETQSGPNYSTEFQNLLDAANKKDTNRGGRGEGSCRGRNSTKLFRLEWRAPFRTLIVDGSTFNWTSEKRLRLVGRASPRPTVICLLLHRSVPRNLRLFPRSTIAAPLPNRSIFVTDFAEEEEKEEERFGRGN